MSLDYLETSSIILPSYHSRDMEIRLVFVKTIGVRHQTLQRWERIDLNSCTVHMIAG
jgi:hypothetical protein